jgi:very-short-patch-repair endonuclease
MVICAWVHRAAQTDRQQYLTYVLKNKEAKTVKMKADGYIDEKMKDLICTKIEILRQ